MAYQWQGMDFNLPVQGRGEVLPQELSNDYLTQLDQLMARSDKQQMDRVLGDFADRGMLRGGDSFSAAAEQVLGPAQDRRRMALTQELRGLTDLGRQERLVGEQRNYQDAVRQQEHLFKLDEMEKQANYQRWLLEVQDALNTQSGPTFEDFLGQAGGMLAGSYLGGIAGGLGAGGAMAGAKLGGLFSGGSGGSNAGGGLSLSLGERMSGWGSSLGKYMTSPRM